MATISSKIVFIYLLFNMQQFTNGVKFGYVDVVEVIKFGHEVLTEIFESWELIRPKDPEYNDNSLPFVQRMEKEIKSRISRVSQKIDNFQEQMDIRLDSIVAKVLTEIPLKTSLDQKIRTIDEFVGQIDDLFDVFEMYSKTPNKYEQYTLEDFARTCVSSRSGALPDRLKSIHRLFVPSSDEVLSRNVLILLANQMEDEKSKSMRRIRNAHWSWNDFNLNRGEEHRVK